VVANCAEQQASVAVVGPILHLGELRRWRNALAEIDDLLEGSVELPTIEPNLRLELVCDHLGHIRAKCEITPDPATQKHTFSFQVDQACFHALLRQCNRVLEDYPVRDPQGEQAS
jgi:hypothetical protein